MADYYVDSNAAGSANGSSWANAYTTIKAALEARLAGDRFFVSHLHAETGTAEVTVGSTGTLSAPQQVICGNTSASPPTTAATTGTLTITGNNSLTINGSVYMRGVSFFTAVGQGGAQFLTINGSVGATQAYDSCSFRLSTSSAASRIVIGSAATGSNKTTTRNCNFRFGNVSQALQLQASETEIIGGEVESAGSAITALVGTLGNAGRGITCLISGMNLAACATGLNLFAGAATSPGKLVVRNCRLPAGWSGGVYAPSSAVSGVRVEMYNCAAGDTNYAMWVEDHYGSTKHETTVVRTGGASNGTTPISWRMASSSSCVFPVGVLVSPEIVAWNTSVGGSLTATVEIVHDSVTALNDDEVWLEVEHSNDASTPLTAVVNDAKSNVLATGTAQTSSSETWTTTGLTNPNTRKLSVTFTPQNVGFVHARVYVAKASATVFVDPKLTIA
jgi:hypothetical protein